MNSQSLDLCSVPMAQGKEVRGPQRAFLSLSELMMIPKNSAQGAQSLSQGRAYWDRASL